MYRQNGKAQRLPPVIPPLQMGTLMGHHIGSILRRKGGGKINHRTEQPQNEGGVDVIAQPHIPGYGYGGTNLPPHMDPAEEGIAQHQHHTQDPELTEHKGPDLGRIGAGHGTGRHGIGQNRIHRFVHEGNAAVDDGLGGVEDVVWQGLRAGNQAEGAFQGKGKYQPQSYSAPQEASQSLRRPLQQNPQRHHSGNEPGGVDAHVDYF